MIVPVNDAGALGIITDRRPHELPLNAWSNGQNVRMRDGFVEKFKGHDDVFGTPSIAPYFLLNAFNSSSLFWLYAGLTKVYVYDGSSHTNITRQTAAVDVDYAATAARNWTGGVLGGIPFLNNGIDLPQFWLPVLAATKLQNLTNWGVNDRASSMRAYKRFMVAMDVTKAGVRYAQMVKWSHPADAGAIPVSWDQTDVTKDAGEIELKDTVGAVIDAITLRDVLCIYKDDSVYGMQFVGGTAVHRFFKMFDSFGMLSRRCAVEYASGKHAVFALGDLIAHDGQNWDSIVSRRMRRWLFDQIDPTTYVESFVVQNPAAYEVWFCFPMIGASLPNQALVWNWRENTIAMRDLPNVPHIACGPISVPGDTWNSAVGDWNSDSQWWGDSGLNLSSYRLLMANPGGPKLFAGDETEQFDGSNFTSYIERIGIPFPVRQGQPPDLESVKFVRDVWPRIEGTNGQTVDMYIGTQMDISAAPTYQGPFSFVIGTTKHIPVRASGRLHAIKFQTTGNFTWRLHGYEVDVVRSGRF